jgi:hypothetical protein
MINISNVDRSIVFILDLQLILLEYTSSVNESTLLKTISNSSSNYLELKDKLLKIITEHYESINNCSNCIFIVTKQAGFTDSRIIFNWLKSIHLFLNKPFFIIKIANYSIDQLQDYVFQAIEENNTSLLYSKEPTIGLKV